MSELKVDTVKTQNENNLVVTEKLSVKDFSGTQSLFTASRENGIKLFGPVYFGNSQHNNSCGKPGQILFGNGATNSPEWRSVPVPPVINIPGNTMVQILIDYNFICCFLRHCYNLVLVKTYSNNMVFNTVITGNISVKNCPTILLCLSTYTISLG